MDGWIYDEFGVGYYEHFGLRPLFAYLNKKRSCPPSAKSDRLRARIIEIASPPYRASTIKADSGHFET